MWPRRSRREWEDVPVTPAVGSSLSPLLGPRHAVGSTQGWHRFEAPPLFSQTRLGPGDWGFLRRHGYARLGAG